MKLVRRERPRVTNSITERVSTGCGYLYVTVGFDKDGMLIEVFAALGKAGGCSHCQNEALTRAISLGLKFGVPVEEFIKELIGNECPGKKLWPEDERVLSCADGIGQVLRNHNGCYKA